MAITGTGLWLVAVLGYVVQTKSVSYVYDISYETQQQRPSQRDVLYLLFVHLSSWILVAPLTQLFSRVKNGFLSRNGSWLGDAMEVDPEISGYNNGRSTPNHTLASRFKHLVQIATLALLIVVAGYTFFVALGLSPAVDVAIMHGTSMFEIVSLLLVVMGLVPGKKLGRSFALTVVILIGIFIVSYTKGTCDLLSGKLSMNESTGELDDPFLFDRLKGALTCGLGALTIGPFFVLWSKWSAASSNESTTSIRPFLTHTERSYISNLEISHLGVANLLIVGPMLFLRSAGGPFHQNNTLSNSAWILLSVFAGHLPMIWALVHLSDRVSLAFSSTCFVGFIVFTALADCIFDSAQVVVTRWEVVGYLMISVAGLLLARHHLVAAKA
ncbi:LAFA_0F03840g1_1 [Lachancea sp. 'fantastica']|nr:LAFA_0F03840g1_1 [Lachancea sp. 'fantastica']